MPYLSSDDLLSGGELTHDIEVPSDILNPGLDLPESPAPMRVKLRPLTVKMVQQVVKAAKDNDALTSVLMLKESLVEPVMNFEQIHRLHSGLAQFLLKEVNRISGLALEQDSLTEAVQAPLAKACFLLAKEFGWTHKEVGELTMGQVLIYLEMIRNQKAETMA